MQPRVYCLLITGKDTKRIAYSRLIGVKNFYVQTYPHKTLIIVNHGTEPVLLQPHENVYEMRVEKGDMTLGDLRNLSLDLVPMNGVFCIFDDDDWRSPDYLSIMIDALISSKSVAVFLKNRLEYNLQKHYCFVSHFEQGNTHILGYKIERLRYTSKDTLEDTNLQYDLKSFGKKFLALDNDPKMYLRIIHDNNTSPHARMNPESITVYSKDSYYKESEASPDQTAYAKSIIKTRYSFFL